MEIRVWRKNLLFEEEGFKVKIKTFNNIDQLTNYILNNKTSIKKVKLRQLNETIDIKLVDFGIAYAYNNIIEINRKLLLYPTLLKSVLKHEIDHIRKPSFWILLK